MKKIILFLILAGCAQQKPAEKNIIERVKWTTDEANAWQQEVGW